MTLKLKEMTSGKNIQTVLQRFDGCFYGPSDGGSLDVSCIVSESLFLKLSLKLAEHL